MKVTYTGVISSIAAVFAIVVIAAHVALFISGFEANAYGGIAYKIVELGCHFDLYAAPLLLLAIALQGAALYLRMRELSMEKPELSMGKRLKLVFVEKSNPNGLKQNLMATSSLLLVVFFVSQLSYLVSHCK